MLSRFTQVLQWLSSVLVALLAVGAFLIFVFYGK